MAEPTPSEIRVRDPLSQVTRNERRFLLAVSVIGITLVKTGLVPSKISALGIEFTQTDRKSLLSIIALITIYFLVAFAIYAASDFVAWPLAFLPALREAFSVRKKRVMEDRDYELTYLYKHMASWGVVFRLSGPLSFIRALFEFVLPLLVGVYAVLLLRAAAR